MGDRAPREGSRKVFLATTGTVVAAVLLGGGILLLAQRAATQSETIEFCSSCHVMDATVSEEFKASRHFSNASGVRATCADCHVPEVHSVGSLASYISVKFGAARFLYGWATGRVSEPDQLVAKRDVLAQRVWKRMRANDSAACRSCHTLEAMDLEAQSRRAAEQHRSAREEGETCIDCHDDGIAHEPVAIQKEETEWEDGDFTLE